MEINKVETAKYYVITLNPSKKNSDLLDGSFSLKRELHRNTDYLIVPLSGWVPIKKYYDLEIPIHDVYHLKISFLCSGVSYKSIYVHGVENIFDVVLTLFVNKMFKLSSFKEMFKVVYKGSEIDPMVTFDSFGPEKEIELSVEKRCDDEFQGVLSIKNKQNYDNIAGENRLVGMESLPVLNISDYKGTASTREKEEEISQSSFRESIHKSSEEGLSNYREISGNNLKYNQRLKPMENLAEETDEIEPSHRTVPPSPVYQPEEIVLSKSCVGLPNLGNTCFMNSAIQCLCNCVPLAQFFLKNHQNYTNKAILQSSSNDKYREVVKEWTNLLLAMNRTEFVSAREFKNEVGKVNKLYSTYDEQDSFEFINNLLDMLHEGLKNKLTSSLSLRESLYLEREILDRRNRAAFSSDCQSVNESSNLKSDLNSVGSEMTNSSSISEKRPELDDKAGVSRIGGKVRKSRLLIEESSADGNNEIQDKSSHDNRIDLTDNQSIPREDKEINSQKQEPEKSFSISGSTNRLSVLSENSSVSNQMSETLSSCPMSESSSFIPSSPFVSSEILDDAIKKGLERDWSNFISKNRSIVSSTFFGMSTNILRCKSCQYTKYKNDPFMSLSLPIPSSIRYHSSITLIFETNKLPIRILADLSMNVGELVNYAKKEYQIQDDLLAIEYKGSTAISKLADPIPLTDVKNRIYLFSYRVGVQYYLCKVSYKKMFIFNEKLPIDMLIQKNNVRAQIYRRLEPYFVKAYTVDELFEHISIEIGEVDKIFNLPVISLGLSKVDEIFGNNLDLIKNIVVEKPGCINIYDCLNSFMKEETVSFSCENCRKQTQYSLKQHIAYLPKILIIQFKRFTYENSESKINTFVDFPMCYLEIGSSKYRLIGTCNHIEIGMGYGHYLGYVLKDSVWYCCNDSVISKCIDIDKRSAYVLFYERVN